MSTKGPTTVVAAQAVLPTRIISPAVLTLEKGQFVKIDSIIPSQKNYLDLGKMCLFPGFVNAHCHLELTAIGSLFEYSFVPWIRDLLAAKAALSMHRLETGISDGIARLLSSGVTTILDHVSMDTPLSAYANQPTRLVLFGEVLGLTEETAHHSLRQQSERVALSTQPYYSTPHAVHTVQSRVLREILEMQKAPLSLHVAESTAEREYFVSGTGEFVDLFNAYGMADRPPAATTALSALRAANWQARNTLIIHGNDLSPSDMSFLSETQNCCLVHCPGSWEFFGHEQDPVCLAKEHGVAIALGTDSITSNRDLDMLSEIRRFHTRHPLASIHELLPLITVNAARAVGLENIGEIREGCKADLSGFLNPSAIDPLMLLLQAKQADHVMIDGISVGHLGSF